MNKILIFSISVICAFLILFLVLLSNIYDLGYNNGKSSAKIPFVSMSYVDRNDTNCTERMPFWFAELDDSKIVYSIPELGSEPFMYNQWYIWFDSYEWSCHPDKNYYLDKEHGLNGWCECEYTER